MRVSDISNWAACESYAFHAPPRPVGRANVAAYVGSLSHAMVADEPLPEPDGRIAYDATTPTERAAQIQATSIAKVARKLLVDRGWGVLAKEQALRSDDLTGHLDIRAWHSDHGEAIIDLKTGQIGTAWLQVGGYINLLGSAMPDIPQKHNWAHWGGVLHVPRVRIDKETKGTLELRNADALGWQWQRNMERITAVLNGAVPTRTPGMHCTRCTLDCPVRIGG